MSVQGGLNVPHKAGKRMRMGHALPEPDCVFGKRFDIVLYTRGMEEDSNIIPFCSRIYLASTRTSCKKIASSNRC